MFVLLAKRAFSNVQDGVNSKTLSLMLSEPTTFYEIDAL